VQVVGVDITAGAIEDARANAAANGIENVEFVCGKAEDVMPVRRDAKLHHRTSGVNVRMTWGECQNDLG